MGFVFTSLQILEDLKMFFTQEPEFLNALNVNLGFFFAIAIVFLVLFILSRRENKKLRAENTSFLRSLEEIKDQVSEIVEGQRLSVILKFEKDPKIDQAHIEANKEALIKRVSKTLDSNPTHPNPDTLAYVILEQIGIPLFVSGQTRLEIQKVLGILIANDASKDEWFDFLKEVIDQL